MADPDRAPGPDAPRVLCAPDTFRGSAAADAVAAAMAAGARDAGWAADPLPLADGGEGTVAALGGATDVARVTGPLGAPVEAGWRRDGATAVVEVAACSGLLLAGGREGNDPLRATSAGVGELIAHALARGARRVVVALGGSATTDGGVGAVEALAAAAPGAGPAAARARAALAGVELVVAADVRTRFLDAAPVFAPQKGASPAQVRALGARLRAVADRWRRELGVDVTAVDGSGAAGGLGGALHALGGRIVDGFGYVAEAVGLDRRLAAADAVLTGEGAVDATTFAGKVVGAVLARAAARGVPAGIVAGRVAAAPPGVPAADLVARFGARRALAETTACVRAATPGVLAALAR